MLKPNAEPASDATFNHLLSNACSGIYRLDMLLLFYCTYLQCMKSDINVQQTLETLNEMEKARNLTPTEEVLKTEYFKSETLKHAVDDLIGESKQSLNKTAEAYYSSKKSIEEITRKNRIPKDCTNTTYPLFTYKPTDVNLSDQKKSWAGKPIGSTVMSCPKSKSNTDRC